MNEDESLESKALEQKKSINKAKSIPASTLCSCLDNLKNNLNKNKPIASLWQDWAKIVGKQLSINCKPISLNRGILTIGASHPHWIQALLFNRNQLLAALTAKGHQIKEIRIQKHYFEQRQNIETEQSIWDKHPSRADIHGMSKCKICNSPAPKGELALWGKCGLCRRQDLNQ